MWRISFVAARARGITGWRPVGSLNVARSASSKPPAQRQLFGFSRGPLEVLLWVAAAAIVRAAMTAARRLLAALLAVMAIGASDAASAGAVDRFHPRPHSDFTLRASGLRIARFDVNARPHGSRIQVSVKLTARSRRSDERVVLRIGRCVGGPATFPSCPPAA